MDFSGEKIMPATLRLHIVRSQKPANLLRNWHIAPDLEVHQNRSVTDWTTQ